MSLSFEESRYSREGDQGWRALAHDPVARARVETMVLVYRDKSCRAGASQRSLYAVRRPRGESSIFRNFVCIAIFCRRYEVSLRCVEVLLYTDERRPNRLTNLTISLRHQTFRFLLLYNLPTPPYCLAHLHQASIYSVRSSIDLRQPHLPSGSIVPHLHLSSPLSSLRCLDCKSRLDQIGFRPL